MHAQGRARLAVSSSRWAARPTRRILGLGEPVERGPAAALRTSKRHKPRERRAPRPRYPSPCTPLGDSCWGVAFGSLQRTSVLYGVPDSRHSKTGAQAPDGLGQGVSGQPGIPATPPDHQIDRQRCDRASFQAGSPCSQPPLTVCISPHARSHAAWRITHYDQCVSYTRRAARPGQSAGE